MCVQVMFNSILRNNFHKYDGKGSIKTQYIQCYESYGAWILRKVKKCIQRVQVYYEMLLKSEKHIVRPYAL